MLHSSNSSVHIERQGEIFGINRSISALSQAETPIIADFVTSVNINLSTWFAAGATLLTWFIFKGFFKEKKMADEDVSIVFYFFIYFDELFFRIILLFLK